MSAVHRSAGRGARRLVTALMALVAMACVLVGPAASTAAAEELINNAPPEVTGHPAVGEDLVCYAGSWVGRPEFRFEWLRNGVVIAEGNPYKVREADEGTSLSCIVIATAGGETVEEESNNSFQIGGSKGSEPKNEELPTVSGTAAVGHTLTCSSGRWSGTAPIEFEYQWLRDGSKIEPASKSTKSEYAVVSEDEGHSLSCKVTATNRVGKASATSKGVEVKATKGPEDVTPPKILGTLEVEHELTCEHGEWKGEPTFTYQWLRNGSSISGATAQTYLVTSADQTKTLACRVTATNGAGNASLTSAGVEIPGSPPVDKTPPKITNLGQVVQTAEEGQTLTCEKGTWTGVPTPTFEYVWVRDRGLAGAIGVGSGEHYTVKAADKGHTLSCEVTATNNQGSPVTVASEPITVASGNAGEPKEEEPPVVVGTPAVGLKLKCEPGKWSHNPEFSYQWVLEPGAPGETAVASGQEFTVLSAEAGHTLACKVTAKNSEGVAIARSNSVSVPGGSPNNTSPPKLVGKPAVKETLTCSQGEWTGAPEPTYSYQWVHNPGPEETSIPGAETNSYVVTTEDRGYTLACEVTAKNSSGREVAASNTLHIPGSQPENLEGSPPQISGTPVVGEGLKCLTGKWTGAPTPTFEYQWLLEGAPIPSATGNVYAIGLADQGRLLSCKVTAKNVEGTEAAISKGVHVPGIKPENIEAPRVEGGGLGGLVTCNRGAWNGKPAPSFKYEWLRNGSTIVSPTTSENYTIVEADLGQSLSCKVIATNSEGTSEATSPSVAILGGQAKVAGKQETNTVTPTGIDPPGPTATAAQILAMLGTQLTHAQHGAHIASLLKAGDYKFSFTALAAGTLAIYWYEVPKGAHLSSSKSKPKPVLVASCTVSFTSATKQALKLRLTRAGRSLLRHSKSIRLTAKGVFTPRSGHAVTWLKTFVLAH